MEAFVVHVPTNWSKLRKLIEKGREIAGFVPKYPALCTGRKVELPPHVEIREDEEGPYFLAGPHERYYEWCRGCTGVPS